MRFSLGMLLYSVTVCTAFVAVLGWLGVLPAAWVLVLWGKWFGLVPHPWSCALVWLLIPTLATAVLLPAILPARETGDCRSSVNTIKQIALALHAYHDDHEQLPPPFTADESGRRLHSWRTLIWPYTESVAWSYLNQQQPWNSPANSMLANASFEFWESCRMWDKSCDGRQTHFFAIVDDATVWPPTGVISFDDVSDKASQTILAIEVDRTDIRGMEPRDLTLDEAVQLLQHGPEYDRQTLALPKRSQWGPNYRTEGAYKMRLVAFLDGHAELLYPCDAATARALLTRSGGEVIPDDFNKRSTRRQIDLEPYQRNLWSAMVLVTIFALPLPWALRRGNRGAAP